jgi:hypothetical protein
LTIETVTLHDAAAAASATVPAAALTGDINADERIDFALGTPLLQRKADADVFLILRYTFT